MRFTDLKEAAEEAGIDKFIIALRNHIGKASSQEVPAKLNWEAVGQMSRANGFEFAADYETFKSMYDTHPILQELVQNFNSHGIVLNVPGVGGSTQRQKPAKDSQAAVDKIAAGAAAKNLGDSIELDSNKKLDEDITNVDGDGSVAAIKEQLMQRYCLVLKEDDKELKKYGIDKQSVTMYQVKQHRAGNKISWDDAKEALLAPERAKEKAAKAAARKANRTPSAPRPTKPMMGKREYEKTVRAAGSDYLGDTMSDLRHEYPDKSPEEISALAQETLPDVCSDMAYNLLMDKDLYNRVEKEMWWDGSESRDVKNSRMQEKVADDIYDAALRGMKESAIAEALRASLSEKAVSKSQQRFMGMVHAAQKGEKAASPEVAKVAKSMGKKDAKDFASTKHKGLPEKKTEDTVGETMRCPKCGKESWGLATGKPCTWCKSKGKQEGFYPSRKLTKDDPIEKWIEHFQKSTNPRFKGKTPEERKKMAIGAFKSRQ